MSSACISSASAGLCLASDEKKSSPSASALIDGCRNSAPKSAKTIFGASIGASFSMSVPMVGEWSPHCRNARPVIGRRPAVGGHYSRAQSQSVVLRVSPAAILPPVRSTGMRSASFNSGCARHRTKRSAGLRFVIQRAVPLQRSALTCALTHGLRGAFFIGGVAAWVCAHVAILFFGLGDVTPCGSLIWGTAGNGVAGR